MKFYITPAIDQNGQYYEIQKWTKGFFGDKYLGVLSEDGNVDWDAQELGADIGEEFHSVESAVKFIRKHYGEKAIIEKWRG